MDQARSVTVDGISYDVTQFSQPVQQAVGVYNLIAADLNKAQLEVMKNQAALQTIGQQLADAIKKELADKAAAAIAAAAPGAEPAANE